MDLERFKKTVAEGDKDEIQCREQVEAIVKTWKQSILANVDKISDDKLDDIIDNMVKNKFFQNEPTFDLRQTVYVPIMFINEATQSSIVYDDGEAKYFNDLWTTNRNEVELENAQKIKDYDYADFRHSIGFCLNSYKLRNEVVNNFLNDELIPKIRERLEAYGMTIKYIKIEELESRRTLIIGYNNPIYQEY